MLYHIIIVIIIIITIIIMLATKKRHPVGSASRSYAAAFPIPDIVNTKTNSWLTTMNSIIYDYFSVVNYGVYDDTNTFHLAEKYQDLSKARLNLFW